MSSTFSMQVTTTRKVPNLSATDKYATLENVSQNLPGVATGDFGSSATVKVNSDAVQATGTVTLNQATTPVVVTINGVDSADDAGADDNATATNIANDINGSSNALVNKFVTAARTFTAATGTFTVSGLSAGAKTVAVNSNNVSFTATGVDADDATALAAALNADATVSQIVSATAAAAVVTMTAIQNETYGGRLGNAVTLTGTTGITRSGATLANGATKVTFTAINAGYSGNAVTLAASAGGGTISASGARLTGGTATIGTFTY